MKLLVAGFWMVAAMAPATVYAQSLGDLITETRLSKRMEPICSQDIFATYFTATAFGYYLGSGGNRTSIERENAMAEELLANSKTELQFLDWKGNKLSGSCHIYVKIKFTEPDFINRFGEMEGDMYLNIENQGDRWTIVSVSDPYGSGGNSFQSYAQPKARQILAEREQVLESKQAEEERKRELVAKKLEPKQPAADAYVATCKAFHNSVRGLMKRKGIEIFEITNTYAGRRDNDTKCLGLAYSDRGRFLLRYGISTTPQGRKLLEAEVM